MEKLVASLSGDTRREAFMASVISESNQPEVNRRSVLGAATAAAVSVAASSVPQPVSAGTRPSEIVMMDAITLAKVSR
jgi:hypothetical protein